MKTRPTPEDIDHIRSVYPPEHNYAVRVLLQEIDALRAENALLSSAQALLDEIDTHREQASRSSDDALQAWRRFFAWWRGEK